MEAWPFTPEEWSRVGEFGRDMFNATLADDTVLRASLFESLLETLDTLHEKYGDHPVLFETLADFTDEPSERVVLYERAKEVASAGQWVTYSIRMSLAQVLLEELDDPERAKSELSACRDEVMACGDKYERREWQELEAKCMSHMNRIGESGV